MRQAPLGLGGLLGVLGALLLLIAGTLPAPSAQKTGDADGDWWGGGGWSAWNDTKYFWLSDVEPTEFFPEDEGFIRVAPKAPQAPGPKDHAKTQRRDDGLATPPPPTAEAKIPSRHGRQLLDVSEEDSNPRPFVESDLLGWEGSGEGSGDGAP
ncbi:uncharacterized protein LOC124154656 [Ischnura elegans]|uniref:uncharacterized protein LOC124154656 n=1 Tax=Ischnura elegans TaxID=197161 RepID=UPI001ED89ED6|nr:uncharacterized protein LOC124154656 [Ischnura elegans]